MLMLVFSEIDLFHPLHAVNFRILAVPRRNGNIYLPAIVSSLSFSIAF